VEFTVGRGTGKQVTDREHSLPGEFQFQTGIPERELLPLRVDPPLVEMNKLFLLLTTLVLAASVTVAQTPEPKARLLALIKEVETQQAQMIDNQGKIQSKLATIGEAVRTSRIWSSRSN